MTGWRLVGIVAASAWLLVGCQAGLHSDLEEREANEMLLVLARSGIQGSKERSGSGPRPWGVRVPRADIARAVEAVRRAGLPRAQHAGFREVYAERGLVPGRLEEQALFLSALQEEIAQTLESVDGVVSARVHARLAPEPRGGGRLGAPVPAPRPSAAVLITHRPGPAGEPPLSAAAVQKLVANAVEGLQPERVVVVFSSSDLPAEALPPPREPGSAGSLLRWSALLMAAVALAAGLGLLLGRTGWLTRLVGRRA